MALINCNNCGKQISEHAIACPHCSYVLNKPAQQQKKPAITEQKSNVGKVFLIILLALGIIAGAYYVYYINSKEYKQKQELESLGIH